MNLDIIKTENLNYDYILRDDEGNIIEQSAALRNVSLSVPEGQFLAVLGHNGCGKSTLAKHFNAILTPTSGKVTVDGIDTADEDRLFDIRQTVGMVFQNPDNQLVATIVEEDVAFAPENLGVPPEEIRVRVDDALKQVDMYEFREHAPHQLSGGQKQRIAIAGIIAMQPRCIVMDEPTAMLDPKGRREVMKTIKRLNKEQGITVILITHYMDEAAQADRVVVMDKGTVIMDDVPRKIFARADELTAVGLDVPQVTELCGMLRKSGVNISEEIIFEDECAEAIEMLPLKRKTADMTKTVNAKIVGSGEEAARLEALTYKYSIGTPFEKTAVDNVDLTVNKAEFVGIIGHTGSGKSTLIQHFNGLVKPTSGTVFINGKDIWSKDVNIRDIRFKVGIVFQYSEHQLFEETVAKDIAYGPKNMGLAGEELDKRVNAAAESMEISHLLGKSPFELSGGQQRRVALAGVLAMDPEVLILDEPAAGLDPKGRDKILSLIKQYHEQSGKTVLLVSHSMEDIVKFATKVLVMNKGKVFCYDDTDKVFERTDDLVKIGLDVPQITRLSHRLLEKGIDIGNDIYTTDRAAQRLLSLIKGQDK
ncbi:MAG: energy-coupling factor transporter ATPase [Ruminococcaceae bacterium]|nr:energy-coupling factor transporter ATPase [Oscillospiraceae bacterium]